MKAYLVLDLTVNDFAGFRKYIAEIPAHIARHGGRYIVQGVQPKTIATKFRRVPVELSSGNATFIDIEEDLSFPMAPSAVLQSYVVYVGFDDAGDRGQPQAKKKAPKAQPKPQKKLERSVAPEFAR